MLDGHCRFVAAPGEAELAVAAGAIVRADARVDQALLDKAPALRVIARTGVGTNLVDDTDAVYRALDGGRLSGVGLDVFDREPPGHHPLFSHPDVVLTPHLMGLAGAPPRRPSPPPPRVSSTCSPTANPRPPPTPARAPTAPPRRSAMTSSVDDVAGAPISWGVCEVPGWGYQLPPDRVLTEMAEVGLAASEFGPDGFLPADPAAMAGFLASHHLTAVGGFTPVVLHEAVHDPAPAIERLLDGYDVAHAGTLVLSAATGRDGYDTRPGLDEAGWKTLLTNLDRLTALAAGRGVRAVLHPHVGTMVERGNKVQRVLEGSVISLCLDTGHLLIGGTDPAELTRQAPDRIAHTHFKDVDEQIAARVRSGRLTYTEGVRRGMYRPLGRGDVDFAAIVGYLRSRGYGGWYVLEQDTILTEEPRAEGPVADVRDSVDYLRTLLTATGG